MNDLIGVAQNLGHWIPLDGLWAWRSVEWARQLGTCPSCGTRSPGWGICSEACDDAWHDRD